MKRVLFKCMLWILLAGLPQPILGWGLLPSVGEGDVLMFRYLGQRNPQQPICVQTQVDESTRMSGLPVGESISVDELIAWEEAALNQWLQTVRQEIQSSGRTEEFADFLNSWPQKITAVKRTDCSEPGVLVLRYDPRRLKGEYRVVQQNGRKVLQVNKGAFANGLSLDFNLADAICRRQYCIITIYDFLTNLKHSPLLAHETGHLLGLNDQYAQSREEMHPHFSFLRVLDGQNRYKVNSLMNSAPYQTKIWPDDIDGIINMADFVQFYDKGIVSRRMLKGWRSFSLGPNVYYAYAMPFKYAGNPQDRTVPQELVNKAQSFKKKVAGIDANQVHQLVAMERETAAYSKELENKIRALKKSVTLALPSGNQPINQLSTQELKQLLLRGEIAYYEARQNAVENLRANYVDELSSQVMRGRISNKQRRESLSNNTAYASREIDGQRYYAYDAQTMQQALKAYSDFKRTYPQYPHLTPVNTQELRDTSTGYFAYNQGSVRRCAGGGEEADDSAHLVRYKYVNKKNQYVTRYFYLCNKHKRPDLGSENFKKYTFTTQEKAQSTGQLAPVTYGEVQSALETRKIQTNLRQSYK